MIAALSLMQRRADIDAERFRRHWLDPHGVMTAGLPGVRRYFQSHCIDSPATNALARTLGVDGFAELWFDSIEDRRLAYSSPRMAECNIDSEQFIGAVTRLVTEPAVIAVPPPEPHGAKAVLVGVGDRDPAWAGRMQSHITAHPGIICYVCHTVLEQMAAPNSRVPELKIPVAGIAEIWLESAAGLMQATLRLAGCGEDATHTAVYAVEDHRLV
jgi:uncharacterized protein (TIGR02118 family)